MSKKPHIFVIEGRFYDDIADLYLHGTCEALESEGCTYDVMTVPGALEIPAAIKYAAQSGRYDAYVALGCVIRGETTHFDVVVNESARAIMDMTVQDGLPIGNGILTCENRAQAIERADPAQKNKGEGAVHAALALLAIRNQFKQAPNAEIKRSACA